MKNTLSKWGLVVGVVAMAMWFVHSLGLRVNMTNSLPIGLYQVVDGEPQVGDLVSFRLPEGHPYLDQPVSGGRQSRTYLKRLVAVSGDRIETSKNGIFINGVLVEKTATKDTDRAGRPLPVLLASGQVPERQALVLSTHHEMSFDGRYYGLLPVMRLQKVVPIWTVN